MAYWLGAHISILQYIVSFYGILQNTIHKSFGVCSAWFTAY